LQPKQVVSDRFKRRVHGDIALGQMIGFIGE
jgi:hypothetical protein